jgi:hypothetical protein
MKQKINPKFLILAAAFSLGLATAASAQDPNVSMTPPPRVDDSAASLLGQRYSGLTANYIDLRNHRSPNVARGLTFDYNQPLQPNLDLNASFAYTTADLVSGSKLIQRDAELDAVAYTAFAWGKPFALIGGGWSWVSADGYHDDSFNYKLGAGVEFQVAREVLLTPFVNFVRATHFNQNEMDYGVKAAFRLTSQWDLTAQAQYNALDDATDTLAYALGVNYRF